MKLDARRIGRFLDAPDPAVRLALVYGPDAGLVRERGAALTTTIVGDAADPFRVCELNAAELLADPARLADEAAALSFTGGRRVVRVRAAEESLAKLLAGFLDDPPGDGFVVVEAGDLPPRSSLRRLAEGAANAAALPCYVDSGAGLEELIRQGLQAHGVAIDRDAMQYLSQVLGGDRMILRQEIEKLALYAGAAAGGGQAITIEDAVASVGDSAALTLEDAALASAEGDHAAVDRALGRLFAEGQSAVAVLRATARHIQRLHLAAGLMEQGLDAERAVDRLRPKVFFRHRPRVVAQLRRWTAARLAEALQRLMAAELHCKSTGVPPEVVCSRALLSLANAARHRPAARRPG